MTGSTVVLVILVEEPSAKAALELLVPKIVPGTSFTIQDFDGKSDLLKRLPGVLRDLVFRLAWEELRVIVVVDRDDDNCVKLKQVLGDCAAEAGLPTLAVLNRIVIDELEAWFLGDVRALRAAYPRLPQDLDKQARYRDPECVPGGTWEALEHLLNKYGYHRRGLAKVEAATAIAEHMDVESNRSTSFQVFRDGLRRLVSEGSYAQED